MRFALSAALALAVGPVSAGCYCSHGPSSDAGVGRDATPSPDAPPLDAPPLDAPPLDAPPLDAGRPPDARPPDAGADANIPEGRYWVPVDVGDFEVTHERCEVREGQTLVLRVLVNTDGCDEPGNVRWRVDPAAREINLEPFVWRPAGVPPCPPFAREIERDVALRGASLGMGRWTVVTPGAGRVPIDIGPPPPGLTCSQCLAPGDTCVVDDECQGQRECVPVRGDAVCVSRCASSCQPFDEADTTGTDLACTRRLGPSACVPDPDLGWTCGAAPDACARCPHGQGCPGGGACEWTVTAWPGACATDADCPLGRSCVELTPGAPRQCEVRCRGDHPCPLSEQCGRQSVVCPRPKI